MTWLLTPPVDAGRAGGRGAARGGDRVRGEAVMRSRVSTTARQTQLAALLAAVAAAQASAPGGTRQPREGDEMPGPTIDQTDHRDGVPWFDVPAPPVRHRCTPQTNEWRGVTRRQRCACGGVRINGGVWINRNARRAA